MKGDSMAEKGDFSASAAADDGSLLADADVVAGLGTGKPNRMSSSSGTSVTPSSKLKFSKKLSSVRLGLLLSRKRER